VIGFAPLAGAAAALWLVKRREPLGALQAFSLGAIAACLALGLALDVPGLSQLFLIYDAQLLLCLFAGAGLVLWRPQRPFRAGAAMAIGLAALLAVPDLGQLARGVPGALSEDWRAASRTPSAIERDYAAGLDWLRAHRAKLPVPVVVLTGQDTDTLGTEALAAGGDEAKRAFEAMMRMKKIDVAAIKAARRG